jgi:KUP system potassium uptake protein
MTSAAEAHNKESSRVPALAVAALGVVFGDIGTSPLYTIKEVFAGTHHPVPITHDNVLGILSLIFWSLVMVVALKYLILMVRADNNGEGGVMALMTLVLRSVGESGRGGALMLLGLAGAALFYGDSVITPAISVLSAVEGLEIAAPGLHPFIIPVTLTVLAVLFAVQRHGTASVGRFFGPVMLLWFSVLGLLGLGGIVNQPEVLLALNPVYAINFFVAQPLLGFFALGATILALTGAEAVLADMGHFGRKPVQVAWFGLVMPGLLLNYFGQGALLLADPAAAKNPFYLLAPGWALYPMIGLATAATVIASQAVISGAYSVTRQAMQLGYLPRMQIMHTSEDEKGQIYLPGINWSLMVAVMALVIGFGSSSSLAAAYGIAVTGTMVVTSVLAYVVARRIWRWKLVPSLLVFGVFLLIDIAYFSANLVKVGQGGWFPLVLGAIVFILLSTWKRGRKLVSARLAADAMPLDIFAGSVGDVPKVPGTAVFLTANPQGVPHALLHSLKHYKCLHEQIAILHVQVHEEPYIPPHQRMRVERLSEQFFLIHMDYGFMDEINVPAALALCQSEGLRIDEMGTSYFLGRETLIPKVKSEMSFWREKIFIAMYRNAGSAAAYFRIPPNRVVELGAQVVL